MRIFKLFIHPLCIIIALLTLQTARAQENYLPGYIIKEGDTVKGFIDYRNWKQNPDVINFRERESGATMTYGPSQIQRFAVSDEIYVGATIQTDVSPPPTGPLAETGGPNLQLETVSTFLQTLVSGEKSLYYFLNRVRRDQFYIKNGDDFELLAYKRYLVIRESGFGILENKTFHDQLAVYFQDCPKVSEEARRVEYKQSTLTNLFKSYFACTSGATEFLRNAEKIKTEVGLFLGASLVSFTASGAPYLDHAKNNESVGYAGGVFLEFVLPRNQRKWSIYNEALYSTFRLNLYYNDYDHENSYTIYRTTLEYAYLKINNMARYTYRGNRVAWFVNAGISTGFFIDETNQVSQETFRFGLERTTQGRALEFTRKHEQGWLVGAGVKRDRFSLEARLEKSNGMSAMRAIPTRVVRRFLMLGYRF